MTMLKVTPVEVATDAAAVYLRVLDELVPAAWHHVERWANNQIEADHSRLKHRLRPMRGLRSDRTATVIIAQVGDLVELRPQAPAGVSWAGACEPIVYALNQIMYELVVHARVSTTRLLEPMPRQFPLPWLTKFQPPVTALTVHFSWDEFALQAMRSALPAELTSRQSEVPSALNVYVPLVSV
jgi:hypothetical protein